MAAQDDINAAVTAIQAVTADLVAAVTNILAEIAALGTPVDTAALRPPPMPRSRQPQAAVDALADPRPRQRLVPDFSLDGNAGVAAVLFLAAADAAYNAY